MKFLILILQKKKGATSKEKKIKSEENKKELKQRISMYFLLCKNDNTYWS